eukprot:8234887-Pyramimonas_sp.AAC.1
MGKAAERFLVKAQDRSGNANHKHETIPTGSGSERLRRAGFRPASLGHAAGRGRKAVPGVRLVVVAAAAV